MSAGFASGEMAKEREGRTSASSAAWSLARSAISLALPAYFLTIERIVSTAFWYSCMGRQPERRVYQ
jgi:hypothetical protein